MMRYLIFLFTSCLSLAAQAWQWQDLWSTPDQQGQELMSQQQYKEAGATFTRNDWAAAAAYRAGDYQKASELYQKQQDEQGFYNEGNALAHLGKYKEAIAAYDKALAKNPKNQDAIDNRKLLEKLLQQQKQDQQKQGQQKQDQQKQDQQKQDQQKQDQQSQTKKDNKDDQEKKQAKEQWLRLIPDDPGGLLREKFLRDHLRRERGWYQ